MDFTTTRSALYCMPDIDEVIKGRLTVDVPEAGRLLGLGRNAAYAAARRGEIPTLRIGQRLLVPVSALLDLVGIRATPDLLASTASLDGAVA